jgi:hypothetical protein
MSSPVSGWTVVAVDADEEALLGVEGMASDARRGADAQP